MINGRSHHTVALRAVGKVDLMRDCRSPFRPDHRRGPFRQRQLAIGNQHTNARARQKNSRRAAVADAVSGRAPSGNDGHPAGETGIILRSFWCDHEFLPHSPRFLLIARLKRRAHARASHALNAVRLRPGGKAVS